MAYMCPSRFWCFCCRRVSPGSWPESGVASVSHHVGRRAAAVDAMSQPIEGKGDDRYGQGEQAEPSGTRHYVTAQDRRFPSEQDGKQGIDHETDAAEPRGPFRPDLLEPTDLNWQTARDDRIGTDSQSCRGHGVSDKGQ